MHSSSNIQKLVLLLLILLVACDPPELGKARKAVAQEDFATALGIYEKLCAEHPKEQLWQVEFNSAVAMLKAKAMDDKRNGPDETLSHDEVEMLIAELLRRKDLEGATDVLFDRARLNRLNKHWLDAAKYLLRAADVVPHKDRADLYEKQAIEVLTANAVPAEAEVVAASKVAQYPKSVRFCDLNATLLAKQDSYDAAINEYTRCQELDPDNFDNQLKFGAQIAVLEEYRKRAAKPK